MDLLLSLEEDRAGAEDRTLVVLLEGAVERSEGEELLLEGAVCKDRLGEAVREERSEEDPKLEREEGRLYERFMMVAPRSLRVCTRGEVERDNVDREEVERDGGE